MAEQVQELIGSGNDWSMWLKGSLEPVQLLAFLVLLEAWGKKECKETMRTRMDNRAQVVMESMFPKHPALEEEGVSVIIIIYSVGGNACMSIVEPAVILTNVCIV